ncbi:MAG: BamA/TamA family outer membrane protein [Ignavibacteriales bacterium]|nr:BamA/TamA family outer membrane protein [Ignavibacteriales bacterium]
MPYRIKLLFIFAFFLTANIFAQEPENFELVSIQFHGNNSLSTSDLTGVIASRSTPNWFYIFLHSIWKNIGKPATYFDSTKIPEDVKALESYYRDNGFFEVKVIPKYYIDKPAKEATIVFHIDENEQFKISSFVVRGLRNLPDEFKERINNDITIDTNDVYSKETIEKNRETILTFLLDHGYMLAQKFPPQILIDTSKKTVSPRIRFSPGIRYKIKEVRVGKTGPGKDDVQDTLLKKLVAILPGDYYSLENINKGQIRLYRTSLFSSVLVNTVLSDTVGNQVPLNINSDIGMLNEFSPEIILNNQASAFNLGLGLSYTKKNFLGDARNFTIGASFAVQDIFNVNYAKIPNFIAMSDTSILGYLDARIAIDQPYLFGDPIRSKLELYSTINKQKEYKSTSLGSKISLDFELPKFVYFTAFQLYYDIDRSKYSFNSDYIKRILESIVKNVRQDIVDSLTNNLGSAGKRDFTTSIIGFDLYANKSNDLLFPSNGYSLFVTLQEANFLPALLDKWFNSKFQPKAQFYKIVVQGTLFPHIYKSNLSSFGMKLKIGYIHTYKGLSSDIPFNSRFTSGGSNSVRGWRARELVPLSNSYSVYDLTVQNFLDKYLNKIPIGGTFQLEGSIETRNRLIGPIGSALFLDFGNTWDGYKQFRFDKIAVAVGFGLRFYSSFAPIRVDFGFKAYDPFDGKTFFEKFKNSSVFNNIEFHLGIGEAF